jgi:hypothetical protein
LTALSKLLDAEDESDSVRRARRYFAGLWLAYDVVDLVVSGTDHASAWLPHARIPSIAVAQVVLILCGVQLVRDRQPYLFGVLAVAARLVEAYAFHLNDFYYYAVVMLLLCHGDGTPLDKPRDPKHPLWVRWALLVELGWIYVATGVLKLNATWLSGGHLFTRTQYLIHGLDWPYPQWLANALAERSVLGAMSWMAALAEISLGVCLWARRPYWLVVTLAVAIHTFAALVTNVWFFSAAMIGLVVILVPRRH